MNGTEARTAPLGALLVAFVGLFAGACAVIAPTPAPSLAEQLPVPSGAVLDIGQDGPGYDGEATFVTYVSQLPPDEAFASYDSQLLAAGFVRNGQDGAWILFSRGTLTIAVSVPDEGPPTTIIVRMRSAEATGTSATGVAGSTTGVAGSTTGARASASGSLSPTPTSAGTCHDNGNGNCQGTGNQKTDKATGEPPPPVASTLVCSTVPTFTYEFTGHGNGARKHELSFYGSYTGQPAPASWSWRFGDGTTATGRNATDRYADAGTYTVVLTVTNGSCSRTTSQAVVAP
jgi:chitodextrinase